MVETLSIAVQLRLKADAMEAEANRILSDAMRLRDAADIVDSVSGVSRTTHVEPIVHDEHLESGRIKQLRDLLREHGPLSRKQVHDSNIMPVGTINAHLTKSNFTQLEDGRWSADKPSE